MSFQIFLLTCLSNTLYLYLSWLVSVFTASISSPWGQGRSVHYGTSSTKDSMYQTCRMHAVRMTQWRNSLKLGFIHLPLFLHEAAPKSIAKWSAKVINSQDREEEKGYEKEELSHTLWKENKWELSCVLAFSTPLRIRDLWGRGQKVPSRVSQQNPWKAQKLKHQLPWKRRWGSGADD